MIMEPDELLAHIRLPRRWPDLFHYYRKVGTRKAQAISKVCFAGTARMDEGVIDHVRIALGSIAPVPLRCLKTEETLRGGRLEPETIEMAKAELAREIVPIDDIRSTKSYRLKVSLNLLEDFLHRLAASGS
jgi:CO/xanthine dehydrogenase FAD-binding subunit